MHQGFGSFHIKSVATGQYLGIDGQPANGVKVIGGPEPFVWNIQYDQLVDPQSIR